MFSNRRSVSPSFTRIINRGIKPAGFFIVSLLSIAYLIFAPFVPAVHASSSYMGTAKPMEFYFHYSDIPVEVAGLEVKYLMNSTKSFHFVTQQEAYENSFYKPIGQPKIVVSFYLYPNLAGPVTIDGSWQVFIWVNGSAYTPTGFSLQFKEITTGGVELWDSGQINPTVTSTIGNYINVPLHSYNLSTLLTHTFSIDTTLQISVEVNAGASTDTRIWYDSPLYPSKAILPATDYARPIESKTYAYDNSETDLFQYNWTQSQRVVTIRVNITDPFGGYDVNSVNFTIFDPLNNIVVYNEEMIPRSGEQWVRNFSQVFVANWSYPETVQLGNYTIKIAVIDNNGYYQNIETGSFVPFIEYITHTFTIGIIVYYNPAIFIVNDVGAPLPTAPVYITWPNGSRDTLPWFTSTNGFLNLTHVLPADYGFTVLWKDVVVNQSSVYIDSDGPYTIHTAVYELKVNVVDNMGGAIQGAYVIAYTQTGRGYGLVITDETGQAPFTLPTGVYNIEIHYSAGYWLSVVSTSVTEPTVEVTSSRTLTVTLDNFPPSIWTTTGFILIIALIIVASLSIVGFLYKRMINLKGKR